MAISEGRLLPVSIRGLPRNFHKRHFPTKHQEFSLGDEKLSFILQTILSQGDLQNGDRILIPFGGQGSIAHFLDYQGIPVILGDIKYDGKYYKNPHIQLANFRAEYPNGGGSETIDQSYIRWDARALPLENESQKIAIVNPPFGVNCEVEGDPIDLSVKALIQLERVLVRGGVAYYVIPQPWSNSFIGEIERLNIGMIPQVLHNNISSNEDTKNPLCLIRIEKR